MSELFGVIFGVVMFIWLLAIVTYDEVEGYRERHDKK